MCLWSEGGRDGSSVVGTSGNLASCSNVARTRRSLLGMAGSIALVVRVDLASWAGSLGVALVWVPS